MATSRKKTTTASRRSSSTRGRTTAGRGSSVAKAPLPKVVKLSAATSAEDMLRKKELIERVVERSGVKKRDARPAVEAVLALLGETLAEGRDVNLPPLGKLRVHRIEEKENARIIVCKLRRNTEAKTAAKDPLAETAD